MGIYLRSWKDQDFYSGSSIFLMKDLFCCLHELLWLGEGNFGEGLRVAIGEWEPARLHLHHDPMAGAEGVKEVRHGEVDLRGLAGNEGFGLFHAVAEFGSHWLAAQ